MIIHGDSLEVLRQLPPGVKCLFADIPDNLGLKYNRYDDTRKVEDYYNWIHLLLLEMLPRCKVAWLTYYPKHDLEISYLMRNILKYRHPSFQVDKFLWRYTFSQYNPKDCAYGYRPFMRIKRTDATMYPDSITEISQRQLLGDARANPDGRVPDNVWSIPRIVGNSWQRVDWMPTQLPIELLERVMKFSVDKDETFIDLFGGSGSALMAAKQLGRLEMTHLVEMDLTTCQNIITRDGLKEVKIEQFDGSPIFWKE